tara:strand:- start:4 stop:789 length:786 start_codon:yes stop_codon:yes gene_type:complete
MSHKWIAKSAMEAVINVLIKSHLNEIPFEGQTSIIDKALNYRIADPIDKYLTEEEIKATLAKLLKESMIVSVNFDIEHRWGSHEIPSYKLSALVKKNIDCRWTPCPRYHPKEEQEAIEKAKAEKIEAAKTKEDAYQQEKQRQEAASFRRHASRQHWIYYIQWESDLGMVKIGYSSKPVSRVASFLTGSPEKLRLLRLEQVASPKEELKKHDKFKSYHYKREWFKYEGALRDYIESLDTSPGVELWEQLSPMTKSEILVDFF